MATIEFTSQQKEVIIHKLQGYFERELEQELGQFDAEFLLDFLSEQLGSYYYNKGLQDARDVFEERLKAIDDDLYAIEKETN